MPGLDPNLVAYALNVELGAKPVVQPMRTFHLDVEAQIIQEIQKLLTAGFIKPIMHPRWLSNIVLVKKKNGQIQCCVGFRNLNKASPKDEFPLPNMDMLIDSAARHDMFYSWMASIAIIISECHPKMQPKQPFELLLVTFITPSCPSVSKMPEPHIKGP